MSLVYPCGLLPFLFLSPPSFNVSIIKASVPRERDELEKGRKGEMDVRRPVKKYDGGTTDADADDDGQGNQQK